MKHNLSRILVIQTASIGDVILATPIIELLHDVYPQASIDFLLKSGIEGIFNKHPFLHEIIIWNKKHQKYLNYLRLLFKIRSKRYDLVVNAQRFFSTGMITAFSGAQFTAGFDKNPWSLFFTHRVKHVIGSGESTVHETQRNLALIHEFAGPALSKIRIYPSREDINSVSQWATKNSICIAPASLWFTKQFPADKWLELIARIDQTTKIYLLGSKADHELCTQIIAESKRTNIYNFAGKLSFLESAALMQQSKMNFVNDSAPMHLASAVNAAVTAIFCSTVPSFGFAPVSDKSYIVETTQKLACRPCGLHGKNLCPEKHFNCAKQIRVEQLLEGM